MSEPRIKLYSYINVFESLKSRIESLRKGQSRRKKAKLFVPEAVDIVDKITGRAISRYISPNGSYSVKKSHTRGVMGLLPNSSNQQENQLNHEYNYYIVELEDFLSNCTIVDIKGNPMKREPLNYIESANTVSKIDTKVNHVLKGLHRIKPYDNRLKWKEEITTEKEETIIEEQEVKKEKGFFKEVKNILNQYPSLGIVFISFSVSLLYIIIDQLTERISHGLYVLAGLVTFSFIVGIILEINKRRKRLQ